MRGYGHISVVANIVVVVTLLRSVDHGNEKKLVINVLW